MSISNEEIIAKVNELNKSIEQMQSIVGLIQGVASKTKAKKKIRAPNKVIPKVVPNSFNRDFL